MLNSFTAGLINVWNCDSIRLKFHTSLKNPNLFPMLTEGCPLPLTLLPDL